MVSTKIKLRKIKLSRNKVRKSPNGEIFYNNVIMHVSIYNHNFLERSQSKEINDSKIFKSVKRPIYHTVEQNVYKIDDN